MTRDRAARARACTGVDGVGGRDRAWAGAV
jgi:hypothetical protein